MSDTATTTGRQAHGLRPATITFLLVLDVVALVILLAQQGAFTSQSLRPLCQWAALIAALAILQVTGVSPRRIWALPAVFGITMLVFYQGMAGVYATGAELDDPLLAIGRTGWFYTPENRLAIYIAMLSLLAYTIGVLSVARFAKRAHAVPPPDPARERALGVLGLLMVGGALAVWLHGLTTSAGLGMLVSSYGQYLDATAQVRSGVIFLCMNLGVAFLAAAAPSPQQRVGFVLVGLWAVLAFSLGLRGEILFPAAIMAVLLARRGIMLPMRWVLVGVFGLLFLIPFIKHMRKVGLSEVASAQIQFSPLGTFTELGASLAPLTYTISWVENGDPLLRGGSYLAPFDRALVYILPGKARIPAAQDFRISNVVVALRVGNIGYSILAEGYRNFGLWGSLLAMALLGMLAMKFETLPSSLLHNAWLGIIFTPLLMHVRNSFVFVPAHIFVGFAILFIFTLVVRVRTTAPATLPAGDASVRPEGAA
jgi:hypothetical protein